MLEWIRGSWLPEFASALGLTLTILGLWFTFREAKRAGLAAFEARDAAQAARDELVRIETFIDLSTVIAAMENIRVLHREQAWGRLSERYSDARRLLIQVRVKAKNLNEQEREVITDCITNFVALDKSLERNIQNLEKINFTRANINLSDNIDKLVEILHSMRGRSSDNV